MWRVHTSRDLGSAQGSCGERPAAVCAWAGAGAGRDWSSPLRAYARGASTQCQLSREQPYPPRSRRSLEGFVPGISLGASGPAASGISFYYYFKVNIFTQLESRGRSGCLASNSEDFLPLSKGGGDKPFKPLSAVMSPQTRPLETRAVYPLALPTNAGDVREAGLMPGSGRSPGGGHGNRPQYSCLEELMDRGAWRAMIHRVAELDTAEVT